MPIQFRFEMQLKKELNHFDTEQIVLNFSNALIGFLTVQSDTLIFTTTNQGRDEIWAYIDGVAKKGPFKFFFIFEIF